MQQVLDWLNDPAIKSVLLLVGGFILKKWPKFVNQFIPLALLTASIILGVVKALWELMVPAAHALDSLVTNFAPTVAAVPAPHQPWWMFVINVILVPVLLAVGAHSTGKNTIQALK